MNATFAPVRRRSRARRVLVAVGRARASSCMGQAARARPRHLDVRVGGQQGRRQRQRPAPVLGGRSRDRRDPALPRVVREPAQVRPARAPGRRASKPIVAVKSGRTPGRHAGRVVAHRRARVAGRRGRRAVPPGRRDPRRHARELLRHRAAARAPTAARRAPGRDRRQRRRARHPRGRRLRGGRARGARALGRDAGRAARRSSSPDAAVRNPVDLVASATAASSTSARSARCSPTPTSTRSLVIFVPPLVTEADDVARAIAAPRPSARRQAGRRLLPRPGGRAGAPRPATTSRRAIPSFAFPEAAARRARPASPTTPSGGAGRPGTVPDLSRRRHRRAARATRRGVARDRPPRACGSTPTIATRPAAGASGSRVAPLRRADVGGRGRRGRRRARLPGRAEGGRAARSCTRPTSAASRSASADADAVRARVRRRWPPRSASELGGVVVQPMVEPGVETIVGVTARPVASARSCCSAWAASPPSCCATPRCGIVPLTDVDAAELVRSLRGRRRCSSATAARRRPTSPRSRTCCCASGMLADELPRCARWTATRSSSAPTARSRSTSRSTSSARPTTPPPRSAASARPPAVGLGEVDEEDELAVVADLGGTEARGGDAVVVELHRDRAVGLDGGAVALGDDVERHRLGLAPQRQVPGRLLRDLLAVRRDASRGRSATSA